MLRELIQFVVFVKDEHKFKQAMRIKNPKNRLKKILDACKNKTKCEGGDEIDDVQTQQDTDEPVKKPKITIEGMKMIAEFKVTKKKSDETDQLPEPSERKQTLGADRVRSSLFFRFPLPVWGYLMACGVVAGFECFKED